MMDEEEKRGASSWGGLGRACTNRKEKNLKPHDNTRRKFLAQADQQPKLRGGRRAGLAKKEKWQMRFGCELPTRDVRG